MPRKKRVLVPLCIHCGQEAKPIPGKVLVSGKVPTYTHAVKPPTCPKGDPLYDEDVRDG